MKEKQKQEKIGFLGGTFDPVHRGHIQLAKAAKKEASLDRIIFIPSAYPPHKNGHSLSSFKHRIVMLDMVCVKERGVEFSDIESRLPAPSFTINTLNHFKELCYDKAEFSFIIGIDAFLEIETWRSYKSFLSKVNILLSPRDGYNINMVIPLLCHLGYSQKVNNATWSKSDSASQTYLRVLEKEPIAVSSSLVRSRTREGKEIKALVDPQVAEYITLNNLYRK